MTEDDDNNTVIVECAPNKLHSINEVFKKEKIEGKIDLTYKPIVYFRKPIFICRKLCLWKNLRSKRILLGYYSNSMITLTFKEFTTI